MCCIDRVGSSSEDVLCLLVHCLYPVVATGGVLSHASAGLSLRFSGVTATLESLSIPGVVRVPLLKFDHCPSDLLGCPRAELVLVRYGW